MNTRYFIGTSGWHYSHWHGPFYPEGLDKTNWLDYYASRFETVELNNTFYRLPSENAVAYWQGTAPAGFVFSVKVSRFITHVKRLRDTAEAVNKFARRVSLLGKKLGPLLYQLPSTLKRDDELLADFLKTLSVDLSHVFEFRSDTWFEPSVFSLLRHYKAGFCVSDLPGISAPAISTADFAYLRLHGSTRLYASEYSDEELQEWAQKIAALHVKTAYIYFNNDAEAFAVKNAAALKQILSLREKKRDVIK